MDDQYDPRDFEREDEDELEEDEERHASAPRVDPIDMHADDWRDAQYGKLNPLARMVDQGELVINFDEDTATLQGFMAKVAGLANAQLDHAVAAGSDESAAKHIKNGVSLANCYSGLLRTRDECLKKLGRGRF